MPPVYYRQFQEENIREQYRTELDAHDRKGAVTSFPYQAGLTRFADCVFSFYNRTGGPVTTAGRLLWGSYPSTR